MLLESPKLLKAEEVAFRRIWHVCIARIEAIFTQLLSLPLLHAPCLSCRNVFKCELERLRGKCISRQNFNEMHHRYYRLL